MKRVLVCLIFVFYAVTAFSQNVKPYQVDLNRMPAVNEDKTSSFDKTSRTFSIKNTEGKRGLSLLLGEKGLDISNYNIIRIKYKVSDGYGFNFALFYDGNSVAWEDEVYYCPSYLTEMVIPLIPGQKRINDIWFIGAWGIDYQQFVVEEITFERVSDPVKTDIWACSEPLVIDTASKGKLDEKISAWDFVQKLGAGFNYNAFLNNPTDVDFGLDFAWSLNFSKPRKEVVLLFKNAGFKMLRLQTSPQNYIQDENFTIDPRYMKILKQFVDWAIEEDMYVIICGPYDENMDKPYYKAKYENDIHVAGYNVSEEYKAASEKFLAAMWKQYAQAFNNSYDEHLIFELLNEPIDCFHEHGWSAKTDCPVCKKDYAILNEYNQLMVDAIRSTGGNNAKRFIIVGGLAEGPSQIITNLFKLPKDKVKDRLIPTFHYYPLGFTDAPDMGHKVYYTDSCKKTVEEIFASFEKTYFKKHIPVIMTETNGGPLSIPVLERINCMKDIMAESTRKGRSCAVCVYWGEDYKNQRGDFDAWNLTWNVQPEYLNTIVYAAEGKEYPLSEEFLKKNEVIIPSIVGKNLLAESVEIKNWDASCRIDSTLLVRSVPPKYKLEFTIEPTDSNAILQVGFDDNNGKWHELIQEKNAVLKGATIKDGWCIKVTNEVFTINIDEKLAVALEDSQGIVLNGENIVIKSVRAVE